MGRLVEHAYGSFGDEARRREIAFTLTRGRRGADDHHGRRPGAPGDHEPARKRVPLDARRRRGRRSGSTPRTAPCASRSRTPGRASRPTTRADLQPVRLGRHPGHRPRAADRQGARRRARRADRARARGGRRQPVPPRAAAARATASSTRPLRRNSVAAMAEPLTAPVDARRAPGRAALLVAAIVRPPGSGRRTSCSSRGSCSPRSWATPSRWVEAVAAFVAYCAASSAAYLVNDVRDAAADRLHPVKRARPIARGELRARRRARRSSAALAAARARASRRRSAPPRWSACVAFLALQAAYSLRLKTVELVDVLAIAALFVLRAAAGAIAVDVRISPWLLLCTFLLALFLALAKRRAELGSRACAPAPALEGYSAAFVDQMLAIVAAARSSSMRLHARRARLAVAVATCHSSCSGCSVPPAAAPAGPRRGAGDAPREDLPILVTVATWAAACAVILAMT